MILWFTWGITTSARYLAHLYSSSACSNCRVWLLCCKSYLMQSYISGILDISNFLLFVLKSFSNFAQRRCINSQDSPWYRGNSGKIGVNIQYFQLRKYIHAEKINCEIYYNGSLFDTVFQDISWFTSTVGLRHVKDAGCYIIKGSELRVFDRHETHNIIRLALTCYRSMQEGKYENEIQVEYWKSVFNL